MYIVFACHGMPFRGDTLKTKSLGGSESACYYIAREMAKEHKVLVFTTQEDAEGEWDGVSYAWCGPATEHAPLGEYCHAFIESTYHDALILQRATGVLRAPIAAKTSFLWLHDLVLIRQMQGLRQDLYQYDGILSVSDWHRNQIADTWEVSRDHITVVPNAVDRSLYEADEPTTEQLETIKRIVTVTNSPDGGLTLHSKGALRILYQSRPERGIDYLVAPGGIMERLLEKRPEVHLFVAGYDNQPAHMQGYYAQVYGRVEELANCTRLPYMDKATLANTQKAMDLLVYPSEFEETSPLRGDSVVDMPSGRETIESLWKQGRKDFWVWSWSHAEQRMVLGKANKVIRARRNTPMLTIRMRPKVGCKAKCETTLTPDHEVMMRDGSYRRADQVEVGESLMPFGRSPGYGRFKNADGDVSKYWYVSRKNLGDRVPEHRYVAELKLGRKLKRREVVDHIDGDTGNNDPSNLRVWGTQSEHVRDHWQRLPHDEANARKAEKAAAIHAYHASLSPEEMHAVKSRAGSARWQREAQSENHVVVAIEQADNADAYCMEVDDTHNFVANGIVVHNCITAMEAQAAGLPFLGSACGALPETCDGGGAKLIPLKDGRCDAEAFLNYLTGVSEQDLKRLRKRQLEKAEGLDWGRSARILESLIEDTFRHKQRNPFSMMRTMLDRSDIMLAKRYADVTGATPNNPETRELVEKYAFVDEGHEGLLAQYDSEEAVSELDKDQNLDMSQNRRFGEVAHHLLEANPTRVLDYGCQKGHYLWTLKQIKPEPEYVGIEISPRVVAWAKEHTEGITFHCDDALGDDFGDYGTFDGLILGEVLEHVPDPVELCKRLEPLLREGARVVMTTPFGDWEGKDYWTRPGPRYHLHHFERPDLQEMFGHHEGYLTTCVPAGRSSREPLGSWVTTFTYRGGPLAKELDWDRKLSQFVPRETVSFCALARNSESTILRSLLSVRELADEFIIALDKSTTDNTREVLERFRDTHAGYRRFVILEADSPLEIGFDEARNRTVDEARGDWVFWMDNDEDLIYPERLVKYLRHNQYDGYAIPQNHMSADPLGILTTDYPVRAFRRVPYLRFNGVVHEHPDDTEDPNHGPRYPAMLAETHILHHGYTTEAVRRQRFNRNLPLIQRDRRDNPDRLLGKLLWMRDLSHMCMFIAEQTQGFVTDDMRRYAEEGIAIFENLLKEAEDKPIAARMVRDGIEYYSNLVSVLGEGFETEFQLHCAKSFGQAKLEAGPRRKGRFRSRGHFENYMRFCYDEQMSGFEKRYW